MLRNNWLVMSQTVSHCFCVCWVWCSGLLSKLLIEEFLWAVLLALFISSDYGVLADAHACRTELVAITYSLLDT